MIVGIIGSGSIGPDLAYGFISALGGGEENRLYLHDISEEALTAGVERIEGYMAKGLDRGKLSRKQVDRMKGVLVSTLDLGDLAECDYVLEAATEELTIKKAILKDLEGVVRPDALIGFATSGIPRAVIAADTTHPERCFVNHPFFPAWRAQPIEVVLSEDEALSERMITILKQLGKVPIVTADVPCFAADDVFCNYTAEAARIFADGVATPAQVDEIVNSAIGGGGPFNVLDLTGGNLLTAHCQVLMTEADTGSEWFEPPAILYEQADTPWHDRNNPGDPAHDEALGKEVLDRVLAVLFARTMFVVDNGICDASEFNWLCANALGFRRGLLDLIEEYGLDRVHEICVGYAADNPGFEVPRSIAEKDFPDFYRNLLVEVEDGIATVTIRRPEVLNALNEQTMQELQAACLALETDDTVTGIVLTSYDGSIAGADIMELAVLETPEAAADKCRRGHAVLDVIAGLSKPVVAAVNGPVLGGGSELAMACHARVVGPRLLLGQPEVNLGIIPGYGGTQRLPRLIGAEAALGMLRSGQPVGAAEACELGWATGEPVDDCIPAARDLIGKHLAGEVTLTAVDPAPATFPDSVPETDIGHRSIVIDAILVDAVREGLSRSLADGLEVEATAFSRCRETIDYDIGMTNFIQNGPRVPAAFMNE